MVYYILIVFGIIASALVILKVYVKLSAGRSITYTCLHGKTVLVTGANAGLGYITALEMAKRGAKVILACRNREKANEAREKIINETDNPNVVIGIVNMSSLQSVREFAKEINNTENRLDILVNNAGAGGLGIRNTNDGLEVIMHVNYFGPFLLTLLLIDLMKKSGRSRIINVSSIAAKWAKVDPHDLNKFIGQASMYNNSKLCNILFTQELAKRLRGTNVTTYSLHPGAVKTEIFRRMPSFSKAILAFAQLIFFKDMEEGAQTQIYLATAKGIEKFSGKHFSDCKLVSDYTIARDPAIARIVWDESEKLVRLTDDEKRIW